MGKKARPSSGDANKPPNAPAAGASSLTIYTPFNGTGSGRPSTEAAEVLKQCVVGFGIIREDVDRSGKAKGRPKRVKQQICMIQIWAETVLMAMLERDPSTGIPTEKALKAARLLQDAIPKEAGGGAGKPTNGTTHGMSSDQLMAAFSQVHAANAAADVAEFTRSTRPPEPPSS